MQFMIVQANENKATITINIFICLLRLEHHHHWQIVAGYDDDVDDDADNDDNLISDKLCRHDGLQPSGENFYHFPHHHSNCGNTEVLIAKW